MRWFVVLAGLATSPALADTLTCSTPPGIGSPSAEPHVVRISDPMGTTPVLHGVSGAVPVRLFKRGRTYVFDAGREALYYDRDSRRFSYTHITDTPALIWRGTCRMEP
ncbi:MAG: hypothetical protein Q4G49_06740 [Paracoccus sp. (in: a-proteobacteria)]|nr:hypothetical protein [Paracoccus sp. (in: a-proteobacteria)]